MDTYAITSLSISQEGSARLKSATKVPEGSRGMSTELQANDKKVEIVCSTKAIEANFKGTELQNLKYPDLTKASRKDSIERSPLKTPIRLNFLPNGF